MTNVSCNQDAVTWREGTRPVSGWKRHTIKKHLAGCKNKNKPFKMPRTETAQKPGRWECLLATRLEEKQLFWWGERIKIQG